LRTRQLSDKNIIFIYRLKDTLDFIAAWHQVPESEIFSIF